eukprot:SAG31_NODE_2465_length_5655_cov_2.338553_9_plen_91_part_00
MTAIIERVLIQEANARHDAFWKKMLHEPDRFPQAHCVSVVSSGSRQRTRALRTVTVVHSMLLTMLCVMRAAKSVANREVCAAQDFSRVTF